MNSFLVGRHRDVPRTLYTIQHTVYDRGFRMSKFVFLEPQYKLFHISKKLFYIYRIFTFSFTFSSLFAEASVEPTVVVPVLPLWTPRYAPASSCMSLDVGFPPTVPMRPWRHEGPPEGTLDWGVSVFVRGVVGDVMLFAERGDRGGFKEDDVYATVADTVFIF